MVNYTLWLGLEALLDVVIKRTIVLLLNWSVKIDWWIKTYWD